MIESLTSHAWAQNAAFCAEWRYWQAKAAAKAADPTDPGLSVLIDRWDGAHETWGSLLELMVKHDPSSIDEAVKWGMQGLFPVS